MFFDSSIINGQLEIDPAVKLSVGFRIVKMYSEAFEFRNANEYIIIFWGTNNVIPADSDIDFFEMRKEDFEELMLVQVIDVINLYSSL